MLKRAGDPDWEFLCRLKNGLPLGVDKTMDRTPRVFEEKTRWKLEEVDGPGAHEREITNPSTATLTRWRTCSGRRRSSAG